MLALFGSRLQAAGMEVRRHQRLSVLANTNVSLHLCKIPVLLSLVCGHKDVFASAGNEIALRNEHRAGRNINLYLIPCFSFNFCSNLILSESWQLINPKVCGLQVRSCITEIDIVIFIIYTRCAYGY